MTTIDEVLQSIKELADTQKKGNAELSQKIKEVEDMRRKMAEDFDCRMKENAKTDEELKKTLNKFMSDSGHQWGKFIETLTSTNTTRLLEERGFNVDFVATRVKNKNTESRYEIDVLAVNGIEMVAIEAKKHLTKKDVDIAKKRFQTFKQYNKEAQKKTVYGAVAYLDCDEKVNLYAEKQGLFVFQVTSNSAIIENKQSFKPACIQKN